VKRQFLGAITFLLVVSLCIAQEFKEINHNSLFSTTSAELAVGGALTESNGLSLKIRYADGYRMPTRGFVWISGSGDLCEDDTLSLYVIGIYSGYETSAYLDTIYLPIDSTHSAVGEFSFALNRGMGFVDSIKIGYECESGDSNDSCYFFSRVVLEHNPNTDVTVDLNAYQSYSDTLSWDATQTDLLDKMDIIPECITFVSSQLVWYDMPDASAEFKNQLRVKYDLTNVDSIRWGVRLPTAGTDSAEVWPEYSDDQNVWYTLADTLSINSAGTIYASWTALPAGAKGDKYIRFVGHNGDGAADPDFRLLNIQLK